MEPKKPNRPEPNSHHNVRPLNAHVVDNNPDLIEVMCEISDGPHKGQRYKCGLWTNNEKASESTNKTLEFLRAALNPDGTIAFPHAVVIDGKFETQMNKNKETGERTVATDANGFPYVELKYLNPPRAGQAARAPAAPEIAKRTLGKLAVFGGSSPQPESTSPPPAVSEDDIPF